MTSAADPVAWQVCEESWAKWLQVHGHTVTFLSKAVGNTAGTQAPMIMTANGSRRAPDMLSIRDGVSEYWEVKFRSRADADLVTGVKHHWMSFDSFRDYVLLASSEAKLEVWVVLYEAPVGLGAPGRWLKASIRRLREAGHSGTKFGRGGEEVKAWIWPTSAMEVIDGPEVDLTGSPTVILQPEGSAAPLTIEDLALGERFGRPVVADVPTEKDATEAIPAAIEAVQRDPEVGRDVLFTRLGLSRRPRYSVLRVGPLEPGPDTDDVLEFLRYGVRVFLITGQAPSAQSMPPEEIEAFASARLLETAVVEGLGRNVHWVVDGVWPEPMPKDLALSLRIAEKSESLNLAQYRIVHQRSTENVLVTAGAGTGKTETMSERLIFLLTTEERTQTLAGSVVPDRLVASDFAFVTFTRESAKEMRERLARSLMLRQRLCPRCVHPVLAWMMQLSGAQVSTIHSFAKRLLQTNGGRVGMAPAFLVSESTMDFRRILREEMSLPMAAILEQAVDAPAAYEWQRHLQSVWDALENKGTTLMDIAQDGSASELDWGVGHPDALAQATAELTKNVLTRVAERFSQFCLTQQRLPASQLVATARSAIRSGPIAGSFRPRYIFVDEFQDTDAQQIDLLLEFAQAVDAAMFIVGDAKQGVYRFRGAEGNALAELDAQLRHRGQREFTKLELNRNYRSGPSLLDSLHPVFRALGKERLLNYGRHDQLVPGIQRAADTSVPVQTMRVNRRDTESTAADLVNAWRAADKDGAVAILCRTNDQAEKAKAAIEAGGGVCELRVGGGFFTTPAVREARALLEAIARPHDDAALLELCETRWAWGLAETRPPAEMSEEAARKWRGASVGIVDWWSRFSNLPRDGLLYRGDLQPLRLRVELLRDLLSHESVVGLLVNAVTWFAPERVARTAESASERTRYLRCIDHLVTQIDMHFGDSSVSLESILEWLRLQIATNRNADEPMDLENLVGSGRTLALTVHKAKGLQFDRVLIPFTATPFSPTRSSGTQASVVTDSQGPLSKVLWSWRPTGTKFELRNYEPDSPSARTDAMEIIQEEARLLYVAMTRAERELMILLPRRGSPASAQHWPLENWADMIELGRS